MTYFIFLATHDRNGYNHDEIFDNNFIINDFPFFSILFQQQSINPYHTYRVDQYHNANIPHMQSHVQSQPNQFYLHENTPPQPAVRRTWAQPAVALNTEIPQHQVNFSSKLS